MIFWVEMKMEKEAKKNVGIMDERKKRNPLSSWQKLGFVIIAGLIFVNVGVIFNIETPIFWWGIGAISGTMLQGIMGN